MGFLIVCKGADFSNCAVDKVELPAIPECEHKYNNACDTTCNICGETRTAPHNYVDGVCTICGVKDPSDIGNYPVTAGLKGLYALGGTADATVVNHAPNPANTQTAVLQGGYEMADNYVAFSGSTNSCRMLTYVPANLSNKVTLVALFSVPDGYRNIIGNNSSADGGRGLSLFNDRALLYANGTVNDPRFPSAINSQNFIVLALTADANGCRVVRYSNGALNTLVDYEGTVDGWTASIMPFIIGGSSVASTYPTARISLAAIHEGDMTDEQLTDICTFVKSYGEQKGLIVE